MAKQSEYDFITSVHPLYNRYHDSWNLNVKSFWGGVEYKNGRYLKQYAIDNSTPSDLIRTYEVDNDGTRTGAYSTFVDAQSQSEAEDPSYLDGSFYAEKLDQVPVLPYTRLYVSEYNAILFRSPPSRELPETPEVEDFVKDVDGEGNSINEFMSMVDTYSTIFGVVWVSCIRYGDADYPLWRMHTPLDVTNWSYKYNDRGQLELKEIVLRISDEPEMEILQYISAEKIDTIYIPKVDDIDDLDLPEGAVYYGTDDSETGYYKISQENTLGKLFVRPIYQSTKIYNGVGHTPIFDIANIQRSIYSYFSEVYSAVSYGSHPVNVIDTETADMNDGAVSAEPGAVIRVNASLNGQPSYVYNFVAPPLDSISELRALIDQKIDKMNEVAMIRSDELLKASRSGVQIEQMDSKLEAFVRKKATSLENSEYQLWKIWFEWLDQEMPEDLSISYSRVYSQKGLDQEISEMNQILGLLEQYKTKFGSSESVQAPEYATQEQAEAEAQRLGGSGFHSHMKADGSEIFMPFPTHEQYERAVQSQTGVNPNDETGFEEEVKEQLKERMKQLIDGSYSSNSL